MTTSTAQRAARILSCAVILVFLTFVCRPASAPSTGDSTVGKIDSRKTAADFRAWLNSPWTDDDKPYATLRAKLDRELAAGADPADLMQAYSPGATTSPYNLQALFAYMYAAHARSIDTAAGSTGDATAAFENLFVLVVMQKAKLPHTYNWARLVFLSSTAVYPGIDLKPIGLRLMAKDPCDTAVELQLGYCLCDSSDPDDGKQALRYQADLLRRLPNSPTPYALAGYYWTSAAGRSHSTSDAQRAVTAFSRYLDLEPKNSDQRQGVILAIGRLEKQIGVWTAHEH